MPADIQCEWASSVAGGKSCALERVQRSEGPDAGGLGDSIQGLQKTSKTKLLERLAFEVDSKNNKFGATWMCCDEKVNESLLFHGTLPQNAESIATDGFDISRVCQGLYGNGFYFSCEACKSLQYSTPAPESGCCIIVARVLLDGPRFASGPLNGGKEVLASNEDSVVVLPQNVPGISPWVCGVWTQADLTRIHRLFQLRWSDPNQLAGKKGVEVTTLAVFEVKLMFDHVGPSGSFHLPLTGSTPDCVIGFARPSFWFLSAFRCVSSQRHCHDPQTKCCFTLLCFMSVMPWSCHTCFQIQSVTGPHRPNRALRVATHGSLEGNKIEQVWTSLTWQAWQLLQLSCSCQNKMRAAVAEAFATWSTSVSVFGALMSFKIKSTLLGSTCCIWSFCGLKGSKTMDTTWHDMTNRLSWSVDLWQGRRIDKDIVQITKARCKM